MPLPTHQPSKAQSKQRYECSVKRPFCGRGTATSGEHAVQINRIMNSDNEESETEHLKFKIGILGDAAVGKTSLARRLAHLEVQTQWVLLLLCMRTCCLASGSAKFCLSTALASQCTRYICRYQPTAGVEFYKAETVLTGGVHISVQVGTLNSRVLRNFVGAWCMQCFLKAVVFPKTPQLSLRQWFLAQQQQQQISSIS